MVLKVFKQLNKQTNKKCELITIKYDYKMTTIPFRYLLKPSFHKLKFLSTGLQTKWNRILFTYELVIGLICWKTLRSLLETL